MIMVSAIMVCKMSTCERILLSPSGRIGESQQNGSSGIQARETAASMVLLCGLWERITLNIQNAVVPECYLGGAPGPGFAFK